MNKAKKSKRQAIKRDQVEKLKIPVEPENTSNAEDK